MKSILSLLVALSCALTIFAAEIKGKCIRVSDGDTLTVQEASGAKFRVRIASIDAPEKSQSFGPESKAYLTKLALDKDVVVTFYAVDRYARILGNVTVDKKDVGKEMLKAGLAWHYEYFNKDRENKRLMEQAKSAKLGLWIQKDPQAPWDYRKEVRERASEYED